MKYSLRKNLLHDGSLPSATQAQYDRTHVQRLKLIRALISSAGLSIAAAPDLLAGLDTPPAGTHALLGLAHQAVAPEITPGTRTENVDQLLYHWTWDAEACGPDTRAALAVALEALTNAEFDLPPQLLTARMHFAGTAGLGAGAVTAACTVLAFTGAGAALWASIWMGVGLGAVSATIAGLQTRRLLTASRATRPACEEARNSCLDLQQP